MSKKILKNGLTIIVMFLVLSAFLTGCPGSGGGGGGGESGQNIFAGSFGSGGSAGKIELYVSGAPLSSYRSLARALTEGDKLYAHIEHEGNFLKLEGAYDKESEGFVLSARTDTFTYAIFGQLDADGDFMFAEISVTEKQGDDWLMRTHLIVEDPTVTLPEDGFSTGLGGVPSIILTPSPS